MPSAFALVTTGPSVTMLFGMSVPVLAPLITAETPAMTAPPWMRQDGLRTVAYISPFWTAVNAGGMASTRPILVSVRPLACMTFAAARAISSLWKKAASIFGYLVSSVSQMRATLVTSQSAGCSSSTWIFGNFETTEWNPLARPWAPVWPSAPWVITMVPSPLMASTRAWVTDAPMNSLFGARKVSTLIVSSGAISVSRSMTGIPASIILLTGAVSVPMPNACIATKSHFCEAMLSIAARCLTASSWPSNQVTSTLNSLPQYSAACLPCAHQVACNPALENAALSGFDDIPAAGAIGAETHGLPPKPPNKAAAPAPAAAA